ncbi:hypothetical protein COL516b_012657 [Colletotrichum fioriniae]|nr:uncharacterized protein COL516b_012657 [Colletotrichum fioriniae]KAJ0295363.1 hypothetical protein COL516b_012657 [Colletotrichum fioriniae]
MSGAQEDMIGYAQELDITVASRPSSRPSSMERQTKLAHLKLVSKYYGYANFSYPRPDGTPTRNPYRRAGQTYSSEDLTQDYDHRGLACPETPTKRDRTSMGSQGSNSSAPSLIDDRTDSEVSLDDDYQYHASATQLWDTFWPIDEGKTQQTPEKAKTHYPALIPSPHIRRAKKTGCINYNAYPLPPRPVEYNIQVQHSPSPTPSTTEDPVTEPQPPASMPASPVPHPVRGPEDLEPQSLPELRRTIRATPTIGTSSGLDTPKSFFDFDSDSDSDEEEPEHTISRFVKTLHKRTASETRRSAKGAAYADAQLRKIRVETEAERIRENQMIFERHKRSGAVFGRMFGRTHARSPNA